MVGYMMMVPLSILACSLKFQGLLRLVMSCARPSGVGAWFGGRGIDVTIAYRRLRVVDRVRDSFAMFFFFFSTARATVR